MYFSREENRTLPSDLQMTILPPACLCLYINVHSCFSLTERQSGKGLFSAGVQFMGYRMERLISCIKIFFKNGKYEKAK